VRSSPSIGYIYLRVFSHATEDEAKVLTATRNTLPQSLAEEAVFQKTCLKGHYGNPITLFQTKLTDKKILPSVLEKIAAGLRSLDKEMLQRDMKLHLEKSNLYLRFDKQAAFMGELHFSTIDPIHFKIHFKNKTPQEIIEFLKETGLLP
jgi:RNA binding exosome subunit